MKQHIHGGDIYRHQNVIDFSSNCNPLGTPPSVSEAIVKSAESIKHYPDVQCQELRCAIEAYEGIPSAQIICGNGAAELLFTLVLARKPKRALLPIPTFAEYEKALKSVSCMITYFKIEEKNDFIIGNEILNQINDELDILFLCNPNNPTGLLCPDDLLMEILKACHKHQVLFVLDECFIDFLDCPKAHTMKLFLNDFPQLFILKAFTKRYAMAGLRLGYGLSANVSLLDKMHQVTQPWNVSVPVQMAGVAALCEVQYVEAAKRLIRQERPYMMQVLKQLGLYVYDSQANYVFFGGPKDLFKWCLEERILIRDCSNYHGLSKGFFRVAVRTHQENELLLKAFSMFLESPSCKSNSDLSCGK